MKALSVVALIALTCGIVHAQNTNMAMATYGLKGPIRTYRTEVATFVSQGDNYVEGPRVLQAEASFNEDGNRTDLRIYNDKGVLARRITMTFDGRKMTEAINYDGAGKMWLRSVYSFDDEGRSNGSMTYDGAGSLVSKRVLKRNNRGLVTESTEFSAQEVVMEQILMRYDGPKLISHERRVYYPNGSLRSLTIYAHETKRSETTTYRSDGSVENKSFRENWDIAQYGPDGSLQKATAVSSEHRLVDEVMLAKDGSATRESQRPDVIDAHGNWTKQTKWLTDGKGTRPLKVTYRELSYY